MKKHLHPTNLPLLVPLASILGLVLRVWTMGGGPDGDGLYPARPLAWALLWLVTAVTLAGIFALTRRLKNPGRYFDNFPASPIGAVGCTAGALGILYSALNTFFAAMDLLSTLTGILGLISAVTLLMTAVARYQGKKPNFLFHVIPCLYFALRIFDCCKHWSNVTQIGAFLFQFLASICIMLAAYQLCCFDVNLGNRRSSLLWSLSGVYFCVLALPMGEDIYFYAGMLLWLMLNLCSLRPLKASKSQAPDGQTDAGEATSAEEAPSVEEAPDAPAEEPAQDSTSFDELLNWLEKESPSDK